MNAIPAINTTDYSAQPPPSSKCRYTLYAITIILFVGGILLSLAAQQSLPGCESLSAHHINIIDKLSRAITVVTGAILSLACVVTLCGRQELHHAPHLRHRVMHRLCACLDCYSPEKLAANRGRPELLDYYLPESTSPKKATQKLLKTSLEQYARALPDPKEEKKWYRPITRLLDQVLNASPAACFECIKIILQQRTEHTTGADKIQTLAYLLTTFKEHPQERLELLKLFLDNKTDIKDLVNAAVSTHDVLAIEQLVQLQPGLQEASFNTLVQAMIQKYVDALPQPEEAKKWYRPLARWVEQQMQVSPEAAFACTQTILQAITTPAEKFQTLAYLLETFEEHPATKSALIRLFLDNTTGTRELVHEGVLANDLLAIQQLRTLNQIYQYTLILS